MSGGMQVQVRHPRLRKPVHPPVEQQALTRGLRPQLPAMMLIPDRRTEQEMVRLSPRLENPPLPVRPERRVRDRQAPDLPALAEDRDLLAGVVRVLDLKP